MTFRQFCFVLVFGPVCGAFAIGMIATFPIIFVIGWLIGSKDSLRSSWEIVSVPPREIFLEGYRGLRP